MSGNQSQERESTMYFLLHKVLHFETLEDRIFDLENKNIELDVNYRILKSQLDKITNNKGQNLDDVTVTATDSNGSSSGSTANYAEETQHQDTPPPPAESDNILSIEDQEIFNEDDESCNNDVINPIEFCTISLLNDSEKNDVDGQSQSSNSGQLAQVKSEVMDFNSNPAGFIDINDQLLMEDVKNKPTTTNNKTVEIDSSTSIEIEDQKPVFDILPYEKLKLNLNPVILLKRIDPALCLRTQKVSATTITSKKSESYKCIICLKYISHKKLATHYQSHKIRVDVKSQNFECKICPKLFQIRVDFVRHMREEHLGMKQHECTICLRKFPSSIKLTTHMKVHTGEKPYSCSVCNRKFSQNINLSRHKMIHSGEKPYGCTICPKKFRAKEYLANHMRLHTGEKPYSCSVCKRKFAQKPNLSRHKRVHSEEMPYGCTFCPKKFRAKEYLVNHIRMHTGEKPYECSICNKKFAHMPTFSRHKRGHSGENEKLYDCMPQKIE